MGGSNSTKRENSNQNAEMINQCKEKLNEYGEKLKEFCSDFETYLKAALVIFVVIFFGIFFNFIQGWKSGNKIDLIEKNNEENNEKIKTDLNKNFYMTSFIGIFGFFGVWFNSIILELFRFV